jgi:hypothetical protein
VSGRMSAASSATPQNACSRSLPDNLLVCASRGFAAGRRALAERRNSSRKSPAGINLVALLVVWPSKGLNRDQESRQMPKALTILRCNSRALRAILIN